MRKLVFLLLIASASYSQSLVYEFKPSRSSVVSELQTNIYLRRYKAMIEETIDLPRNIPVIFCDCNQENAFYNSGTKSITICYEFVQNAIQRLNLHFQGQREEKIGGVAVTVLGHELGHALVDQLSLPVTGKEESAVDEFSVVWSLNNLSSLYTPLFFGIVNRYYRNNSFDTRLSRVLDKKAYHADVHAPDIERYYDTFSVFCGYDYNTALANKYIATGEFFKEWKLPPNRAEKSLRDYNKAVTVWTGLLKKSEPALGANTNSTTEFNKTSANLSALQQGLTDLQKALEENERVKLEEKRKKRQNMVVNYQSSGFRRFSMLTSLGDIYTDSKCFVFPTPNLKNRQIEGIIEIDARIDRQGKVIAQKIIYSDVRKKTETDCLDYLLKGEFIAKCDKLEEFTDTKIVFHFK